MKKGKTMMLKDDLPKVDEKEQDPRKYNSQRKWNILLDCSLSVIKWFLCK